jgi:hypothetical protein
MRRTSWPGWARSVVAKPKEPEMSELICLAVDDRDAAEVPTVVTPAIGNATFAATGIRLRRIPIRPTAVPQALPW